MQQNATPKLRKFAQRLLVCEAAEGSSPGAGESAGFRVCERLRQPLGKLMGAGGFHALFSRARTLAAAEVSWLGALQIQADGSLSGLEELEAKLSKEEIASGEVVLIAHLLGLLATFIGSALTLRLVQEVWPEATLDDGL